MHSLTTQQPSTPPLSAGDVSHRYHSDTHGTRLKLRFPSPLPKCAHRPSSALEWSVMAAGVGLIYCLVSLCFMENICSLPHFMKYINPFQYVKVVPSLSKRLLCVFSGIEFLQNLWGMVRWTPYFENIFSSNAPIFSTFSIYLLLL